MMMRYRKKPVEIEATQWDGTAVDATRIIEWVLSGGGTANYRCDGPLDECPVAEEDHYLVIQTLEGGMQAGRGDWIIQGVAGEFYPCKPDIFEQTYDPVP